MIVNIGIISKKEGITTEEFREEWLNVRGPNVAKIQGLLGYTQNHIIGAVQNVHLKNDIAVDGFDEMWFGDVDSMENFFTADDIKSFIAGKSDYIGKERRFVCEYHTIVPTAETGEPLLKRMSFIKMRPHVTEEIIRREWLGVHSELAGSLPGIKGYAQSLVINHALSEKTEMPDDKAYLPFSPVDGFAELWFENEQAMIDAFSSPVGQKALSHAKESGGRVTTFQIEEFKRKVT